MKTCISNYRYLRILYLHLDQTNLAAICEPCGWKCFGRLRWDRNAEKHWSSAITFTWNFDLCLLLYLSGPLEFTVCLLVCNKHMDEYLVLQNSALIIYVMSWITTQLFPLTCIFLCCSTVSDVCSMEILVDLKTMFI